MFEKLSPAINLDGVGGKALMALPLRKLLFLLLPLKVFSFTLLIYCIFFWLSTLDSEEKEEELALVVLSQLANNQHTEVGRDHRFP